MMKRSARDAPGGKTAPSDHSALGEVSSASRSLGARISVPARGVEALAAPQATPTMVEGAHALGVTLDSAQHAKLEAFLDLLQRWGRTYNLTAILDRPAMRVQHLLDSLALVPHLPVVQAQSRPVLLDVGSGAGLPGVVVAIAKPEWTVVCVDAVAKKVGFLRQVAAELRLPQLQPVHSRIEALAADAAWRRWAPDGAEVVTSRAFASLPDFVRLTHGRLAVGGQWLAMKGQSPDEELTALARESLAAGLPRLNIEVLPLRVPGLDARRCLVRMTPVTP